MFVVYPFRVVQCLLFLLCKPKSHAAENTNYAVIEHGQKQQGRVRKQKRGGASNVRATQGDADERRHTLG